MSYPIKQVLVVRKDLNMNKGKMIAQCAHASMSFLCRALQNSPNIYTTSSPIKTIYNEVIFSDIETQWITGSFAKITLQVNSEEELQEIYDKASAAGLVVHMIIDSGKTYFKGIPTKTCLAIGPDLAEKIDPITGELKLI